MENTFGSWFFFFNYYYEKHITQKTINLLNNKSFQRTPNNLASKQMMMCYLGRCHFETSNKRFSHPQPTSQHGAWGHKGNRMQPHTP